MRVNEFLRAVIQETRRQLPPRWRDFDGRARFTLIQLYYTTRSIHYEVWVRGSPRFIEVGLHCESDRETNARWLEYFRAREFEIRGELGTRVETEQWTESWTRVHQLIPYEKLDVALVTNVATELAKMIVVLQPMLIAFNKRAGTKATSRRSREGHKGN